MEAGHHLEIERKFLVDGDQWRALADAGTDLRQGYLVSTPRATVRVRQATDCGWITIKGATRGITREEWEYEITANDAATLLEKTCAGVVIAKTRYRVTDGTRVWEVDVFRDDNAPLVLAEIELAHATENPARPECVGEEVTGDSRYYNAYLAQHPYGSWAERSR